MSISETRPLPYHCHQTYIQAEIMDRIDMIQGIWKRTLGQSITAVDQNTFKKSARADHCFKSATSIAPRWNRDSLSMNCGSGALINWTFGLTILRTSGRFHGTSELWAIQRPHADWKRQVLVITESPSLL
jgi:hypothetical protein